MSLYAGVADERCGAPFVWSYAMPSLHPLLYVSQHLFVTSWDILRPRSRLDSYEGPSLTLLKGSWDIVTTPLGIVSLSLLLFPYVCSRYLFKISHDIVLSALNSYEEIRTHLATPLAWISEELLLTIISMIHELVFRHMVGHLCLSLIY